MDLRKYYLDEIMKLDSDNSIGLSNSVVKLEKYADVVLKNDENNNLFFECKVEDILNSEISNEELIMLRNGGWEYNKEKNCLTKKL